MRENTYKTHQKILGSVMIAYSAMNIFGAISLLAALNFINIFVNEADIAGFVNLVSHIVGFALLVVSVPALIGGIGLLTEKEWSKSLVMVCGVIYLVFIPVGTIIGIYSIWLSSQNVIHEKQPVLATDLVKHAH